MTSHHFYPRYGLLDAPLTTLTSLAADAGKKLVFATVGEPSRPIKERCHFARIREFGADDYEALCRCYLGDGRAGQLDYRRIYRFARELNAQSHARPEVCASVGRSIYCSERCTATSGRRRKSGRPIH